MPEYRTSLRVVDKPTKELADSVPVKGAAEYRQTHTWDQALRELKASVMNASNLAVTVKAAFGDELTPRRFDLFNWVIGHLQGARRRVEDLNCSYPFGKGRGA